MTAPEMPRPRLGTERNRAASKAEHPEYNALKGYLPAQLTALIGWLMAHPEILDALLVAVSLEGAGRRVDAVQSAAFARLCGLATLAWCPRCFAAIMAWPDGVDLDWPARTLHACEVAS